MICHLQQKGQLCWVAQVYKHFINHHQLGKDQGLNYSPPNASHSAVPFCVAVGNCAAVSGGSCEPIPACLLDREALAHLGLPHFILEGCNVYNVTLSTYDTFIPQSKTFLDCEPLEVGY